MPDPLLPSDHGDADDELVAAYVDGEATPDEVARVEASAELRARVEAFAAVADLVGADPDPDSIDPDLRDRHIAAALAASTTATNVTSMAPARAQRRPWYRQPVAAVAAVIIAAVVAIPVVAQLGGSDEVDTASTEAGDSQSDEATDAASAPEADQADADASRSASPAASQPTAELTLEEGLADGADGAAGDGGEAEEVFGAVTSTAPFNQYSRRLEDEGEAFADFESAIEAYDRLRRELDQVDETAPATEDSGFALTEPVLPACVVALDDELIVVADVDGRDVVLGVANDETLVLDAETCEIVFGD
ncbi:MAG: hypothetical protein ACR2QE_14205 [Acidimicrobiales bacterium]